MKRIYAKEDVCMACHLCEVNCLVAHSQSKDYVKAYKKELPRILPRMRVDEQGVVSFATVCHHCLEPICVHSCITGAMRRDPETGIVTVDRDRCVGCWTCVLVCPFGAIIPDTGRGKVTKCDLCPGRETPACVANCPNESLVYAEEPVKA